METKINQVIKALFELEAKECHRTFFEYGNGLFRVRIVQRESEKVVYEKQINVAEERKELKKLLKHVTDMIHCVMKVPYQCYRRKFVKGIICDEWEKTNSIIEFGKKATAEKTEKGFYIDDFENSLQYFVDYSHIIKTNKQY